MAPLWNLHYEEVGEGSSAGWTLEPDISKLNLLSRFGVLQCIVARDSGKIVGYFASLVEPLLHYKQILADKCDLYWLAPDYRKGFAGIRLLQFAEEMARKRGCKVSYLGCKLGEHDYTKLFEHLGYEMTEKKFRKVLV